MAAVTNEVSIKASILIIFVFNYYGFFILNGGTIDLQILVKRYDPFRLILQVLDDTCIVKPILYDPVIVLVLNGDNDGDAVIINRVLNVVCIGSVRPMVFLNGTDILGTVVQPFITVMNVILNIV